MFTNNLLSPLIYGFIGASLFFLYSIIFKKRFKKNVKFIQSDNVIYSIFAFFVVGSVSYFIILFKSNRGYITSTEAVLFSGILALFLLLTKKSK